MSRSDTPPPEYIYLAGILVPLDDIIAIRVAGKESCVLCRHNRDIVQYEVDERRTDEFAKAVKRFAHDSFLVYCPLPSE